MQKRIIDSKETMPLRLLFVTQTVDRNDPVLGFVARWIEEFVAQDVRVTVFARILKKADLPSNVSSEEIGKPKLRRVLKLWFYSIKHRKEYDAVLIHMTPEILVMGWPVWFLLRKKVSLWYIHPHVSWWLRISVNLCKIIFTATERSVNVKTEKKKVVGHGIDTDLFKPTVELKSEPDIYYVGRISPVKRVENIIDFLGSFHKKYPDCPWTFIMQGSSKEHELYYDGLMSQAAKLNIADRFVHKGAVTQNELPSIYSNASVTMSATPTGSLDKVVLESLACGTPVFAVGKDYVELPGVTDMNSEEAHERLYGLLSSPRVDSQARKGITERHDLKRLIASLIKLMSS
ncbi:MAG: glycosyltransferase family 4 protein [Patescibacteria group bacterium]|jgi:glycosyltransferase involved in cell wall biosynthesis